MDTVTLPSGETISANDIQIPMSAYKLRIIKIEKATSQKGQPMFKGTYEIIDHPGLAYQDAIIDINGLEIQFWASQSEKAFGMFNIWLKALGQSTVAGVQEMQELDPGHLIGLSLVAVCKSEAIELKDEAGNPVINPYDGKPVVNYSRKVTQCLLPPRA